MTYIDFFNTESYLPDDFESTPALTTDQENALALEAQAGDEIAFAAIYRKNEQWIMTKALRFTDNHHHDAQDLCQDIFVKAWENLDKWSPARGNFYSWLWTLTHRTCLDADRKASRNPVAPVLPTPEEAVDTPLTTAQDESPCPERQLEMKEARERLESALCRMDKPHHRSAFMLRHLEGYDIAEIARILDQKPSTVKVWINRAKTTLRRILEAV